MFFNGPGITDDGLAELARLSKLKSLGVHHSTKIKGLGIASLASIKTLTAIEFGGSNVGDDAAALISQIRQLNEVRLGHVRITKAAFPMLATLPELKLLLITPNWSPAYYTAHDFSAFTPMQKLNELEIHDMVLPWEDGLAHLKVLKELKILKLYWCYIKPDDLEKLKKELPGVKLDIRTPAGEDRLIEYNRRVEQLKKS